MPVNKTNIVQTALILRIEFKRFGRVDKYYIDAEDSCAEFLHIRKDPNKATAFKSYAEVQRLIDWHTSNKHKFEILHLLDYKQIQAS
jgi:hypothetical protein